MVLCSLGMFMFDFIVKVGGFVVGMDVVECWFEKWCKEVEKNVVKVGVVIGVVIVVGIIVFVVFIVLIVCNVNEIVNLVSVVNVSMIEF